MSKSKKSLDPKVSKTIISCICAVLCVAMTLVTVSTCTDKITDSMLKCSEIKSSAKADSPVNSGADISAADSQAPADESQGSADAAASQQPGADAADSSESQSGGNQASSAASQKPEEQKNNGSGIPSTKAEILNYLNTSLNNAKKAKPGYKKHHVMQAKGNVSGIPSWLVNLVTKDKTTTMAKGGDNTDDFPAAGFAWSSKLTVNDIKDASLKQNGDNYEITVKLGTEKNPSKGTGSSYGKVMSVIDANEAAEMVGKTVLKSIDMTYHDGYVKATVNSKTGKLVSAEFSAAADIQAKLLAIGDISVTDIVSTETFTDFKW